MELRELKALEIAARNKIAYKDAYWIVPSQGGTGNYRVTIGEDPSCQCDDFQLRHKPCKHIMAARIVCARDHGGKAPAIKTDAVPKRPTYSQNWPKYNEAQITEKRRFQVLLADLCRNLPEPPRKPGRGRKPTPLRDVVFACVFKIYSTFSSRRFGSDLDEAHQKGYLLAPMHPNKINCHLENAALSSVLKALIERSALPLRTVETTFAPDSSGFSTCRFVRWYDEKYGVERSGREWVKAHAICGTKTHIVTAVEIHHKDAADSPQFKPLVEATAKNFDVKEVPADKAYLSHDNLGLVESLGGTAFVPFKVNSVAGETSSLWNKMYGYFEFRREDFLKHYHQRSNIESVFSMVKRKLGDFVRSKTDTAMANEVFCKFLAHNICCVIAAQCELGIEPVFWHDEPAEEGTPDVLPMVR